MNCVLASFFFLKIFVEREEEKGERESVCPMERAWRRSQNQMAAR
jgi:hypothetical protein